MLVLLMVQVFAQKSGYVQCTGKVRADSRPVSACDIKISQNGSVVQTAQSKENGSFVFNLDLQKDFIISYSKSGFITKSVIFETKVPQDQSDIIYQVEFNIDLFADVEDVSRNNAMTKPVAKYSFNPAYEDFVHDENYTKSIQAEQDKVRKEAEALAKQKDKGRLDSLNKIWSDSLVKARERDSLTIAQKAEQDRIRKEREKARADSIALSLANTKALAELEAKEKVRRDSIARAEVEKAKLDAISKRMAEADSIAKLEADRKKMQDEERMRLLAAAKEKTRLDSMAAAAALTARRDSLAAVKARADAEASAKTREQARKDSVSKAELAMKAREKFVEDSTAKADAEKKRLDALAKIKADTDAKAREQARRDSMAGAEASSKTRQKYVADSTAQANAEKTKQEALAKVKADSENKAREAARKDSLVKAQASFNARQKFVADSSAQAQAEKIKQGAQARAKADAEGRAQALARKDSLAKAESASTARQKFVSDSVAQAQAERTRQDALAKAQADAGKARQKIIADSTAKAQAEKARLELLAKAKEETNAKAKAEEQRQKQVAEEKAIADSITAANQKQKDADDAERKAKIQADILAKKELLAKTYSKGAGQTQEKAKPSVAIPRILDSDYKEGVTEETISESNRTIYRTVVKKAGATNNYQKIAYTWGGVFYFKNQMNMTETSFEQEIKNAKSVIKN